jgi:F-type H+-transporting ATPase subunit b
MELSWTTIALEAINFLILVWLLKRFLYRPVLNVIARRKEDIDKKLSDAEQTRAEADELRERYEGRLDDWEQEKNEARRELQQELDEERSRKMGEIETALEAERERSRVLEQRRAQETVRDAERTALEQTTQFAARLLTKLAGPELQPRLINMLVEDLAGLPAARRRRIAEIWHQNELPVRTVSACALSSSEQRMLEDALDSLLGEKPRYSYDIDTELVAGVRVHLGATVLRANLLDELAYFAEFSDDDDQNQRAEG